MAFLEYVRTAQYQCILLVLTDLRFPDSAVGDKASLPSPTAPTLSNIARRSEDYLNSRLLRRIETLNVARAACNVDISQESGMQTRFHLRVLTSVVPGASKIIKLPTPIASAVHPDELSIGGDMRGLPLSLREHITESP